MIVFYAGRNGPRYFLPEWKFSTYKNYDVYDVPDVIRMTMESSGVVDLAKGLK
jgi:hypothetical protein